MTALLVIVVELVVASSGQVSAHFRNGAEPATKQHAPACAPTDSSAPDWNSHIPQKMVQRNSMISLLERLYRAHSRCEFPESLLSQLTAGGGTLPNPSATDAKRGCAGEFRVLGLVASPEGNMATLFAVSGDDTKFKGEEVMIPLVFVEEVGQWRAYTPAPVVPGRN